jgi:hypothetical protein
MGDFLPLFIGVTYPNLEKVLAKLNAKLSASGVHAMYLGAVTSTSFQLLLAAERARRTGAGSALGARIATPRAA